MYKLTLSYRTQGTLHREVIQLVAIESELSLSLNGDDHAVLLLH